MANTSGSTDSAIDVLVEQSFDDEERTILLRYLRLSGGDEFQIAAVEVPTPAARDALIAWLGAHTPDRPMITVSLKGLPGHLLVEEIPAALPPAEARSPRAVLVLTDLESVRGAATETHPSLFMRLNLERDPLVRVLPMTCLLLAHPVALLKLRMVAPDFCHYFSTLIRQKVGVETARAFAMASSRVSLTPSASLELSDSDWPALLREADNAFARNEFDRARDHVAEFRATAVAPEWSAEALLIEGALDGATRGAREGLASLAMLDAKGGGLRPATSVRLLLKRGELTYTLGDGAAGDTLLEEAEQAAVRSGRDELRASALTTRADRLVTVGEHERARGLLEEARAIYAAKGRVRDEWGVRFGLAFLDGKRGDWDACIEACTRYLIPTAHDVLGDERLEGHALVMRAETLRVHGRLGEALSILREDVLPVFDRLGDVSSRAVTLGKIADILLARGELDEALRIFRDEALPVFDWLGDVRSRAVAQGRIANILHQRGELGEALRIHREETLPVFDRLGDVRERTVTVGKIADIHQDRGELDEALRMHREEELPVYKRLGLRQEAAGTRAVIGFLLSQKGRHSEAFAHIEQAREEFDRLGLPRDQIWVRMTLANAYWNAGDQKGALRESQAALSRAEAQREPSFLLRATENIVTLLIALRRVGDARSAYDRVSTILAEDGRWDALNKLDALRAKIDRASAPPKPLLPPMRRR